MADSNTSNLNSLRAKDTYVEGVNMIHSNKSSGLYRKTDFTMENTNKRISPVAIKPVEQISVLVRAWVCC